MKSGRILLAATAALGVFGLGYLAGQSATRTTTGDTSTSPATTRQANHTDATPSADTRSSTKSKARSTHAAPNPEKGFSRRIVGMMGKGELAISGVNIDSLSLQPGQKVKEFLDLTDEQLETMARMGRARLRAKQEHEESIATIQKATDQEFIFDVSADPAFAASEKEAFIEDLRKEFGPDVADMLQTSIGQAYIDFEHPRHVRITVTPDSDDPDMNYVTVGVNQNEDGTFMKNERGMTLPNAHGLSGSIHRNKPDATFSRYHYLWAREKQR